VKVKKYWRTRQIETRQRRDCRPPTLPETFTEEIEGKVSVKKAWSEVEIQ
jgi:hypothetical protein